MKFTKNVASLFLSLFLLLTCVTSNAAPTSITANDPPPLVMLKNTSNQMIAELDRNLGRLRNNIPLVSNIVKRILVPHFDLVYMAQLVVGRTYWDGTSRELQQHFIGEFTNYVIKTYASAISSYDGEVVKFYPIRDYASNQPRVQVSSDIEHRSGPPIQMQYRVISRGNTWLVYDFSVDGVSIVQNYRSQFAATLRQGGLVKLVQELERKNR